MAQDKDTERELPATEQRIRKAREEGNLPRSRELSSGALLLSCVLFFWAFGGHFTSAITGLMQRSLSVGKRDIQEIGMMGARLGDSVIEGFLLLVPLMGFATLVAICSTLAIGGFNYSEKNYEFKASRINPIAGFARLFSANAAFEVVKAILKVVVIGLIAWRLTIGHLDDYATFMVIPVDRGIALAGEMAIWDSIFMSLAFFLIIAIDAPYQLWKYYRDLRMSLQEVKDEAKESDGDPMLKGRIRQMQRERARQRMMSKVPKADVVVTNPTHYSVALSYSDGIGRAPVVVAKGKGDVALKIRELAAEHKVPMIEMPPLARALYAHVDLDREIPSTLFTAVAKLLAYVMTLKAGSLDSNLFPLADDIPSGLDPGPSAA
jgi:flagellar biosynthetic protein FlhB